MHQRPDLICPICSSDQVELGLKIKSIPAQDGVVWPSYREAKLAPSGDISLSFCHECTYIYNHSYDDRNITFQDYDFSLHYSSRYQRFIKKVIENLIRNHNLYEKQILGIACGKGHFLIPLCEAGGNYGIGIDPSFKPVDDLSYDPDKIRFEKDYYSEKYYDLQVDFITCRHLLDELSDPVHFLKLMANNLDENHGGIYLEVPNAHKTLSEKLIWNVGYAKRSWYVPQSIDYQLRQAGFTVQHIQEYLDGDYLGIEAELGVAGNKPTVIPNDNLLHAFRGFDLAFRQLQGQWIEKLVQWKSSGQKVAIWGAGMRAINFLSVLPEFSLVDLVIDINPDRQGKYLPISAIQVSAPEVLENYQVDRMIISNATYKKEIIGQAKSLGFGGEVEVF